MKILNLGLKLFSVLSFLLPLLFSFWVHREEPVKAVFDPSQLRMAERLEDVLRFPENAMVRESYTLGENGGRAVVRITSPSKFPLRIENLTGWAVCRQHPTVRLAWLEMEQPVDVNPGETKRFSVIFRTVPGAAGHVLLYHLGFWPETKLENAIMRIRVLGAQLELKVGRE